MALLISIAAFGQPVLAETVAPADECCSVAPSATPTVSRYDVGLYDDLVRRSEVGDGLDIHHVMQDHPAQQLIPGATRGDGPAIALPAAEHRLIPNLKGDVDLTPRQLLARDAWNLRNFTNAPNRSIQELIDLNKARYPEALAK